MSIIAKVKFIMLSIDSNPFQEWWFTVVCISTLLEMVSVKKLWKKWKCWLKRRSTRHLMQKHLWFPWARANISWLKICSLTIMETTLSFLRVNNWNKSRTSSLNWTLQMFIILFCSSIIEREATLTTSLNWSPWVIIITSRNVVFQGKFMTRFSSSKCWLMGLGTKWTLLHECSLGETWKNFRSCLTMSSVSLVGQ